MLHAHAEIRAECMPLVDVEHALSRIRSGQVGYDALRVLRSCGDPMPRYARVLDAFEVAGFLSNDDRRALLHSELDVDDLVSGWFTGDRTPRESTRRIARLAAIVVGNALLRAASGLIEPGTVWREWTRIVCPCCGGSQTVPLHVGQRPRARQACRNGGCWSCLGACRGTAGRTEVVRLRASAVADPLPERFAFGGAPAGSAS